LLFLKVKRLKVATFIYCHLQGNPDQQRFTMRSGWRTDRQWQCSACWGDIFKCSPRLRRFKLDQDEIW